MIIIYSILTKTIETRWITRRERENLLLIENRTNFELFCCFLTDATHTHTLTNYIQYIVLYRVIHTYIYYIFMIFSWTMPKVKAQCAQLYSR